MDSQTQSFILHDLPELCLSVIWQHVCELPMADRRALLATCKKALSMFGGLIDRMERLELTMKQVRTRAVAEAPTGLPCSAAIGCSSKKRMVAVPTINAQAPQPQGSSSSSMVAWQTSNAPRTQQQQRGSFRTALLILSCFPRARLEHLDLHFRDSPGLMLSPALAAFFLNSPGALEQVDCLGMNCKEVSEGSRV